MKILVTGGAGFIGSALVRALIASGRHEVVNLDKLTYASNLAALASVRQSPRYKFAQLDICDRAGVAGRSRRHTASRLSPRPLAAVLEDRSGNEPGQPPAVGAK